MFGNAAYLQLDMQWLDPGRVLSNVLAEFFLGFFARCVVSAVDIAPADLVHERNSPCPAALERRRLGVGGKIALGRNRRPYHHGTVVEQP